jgi:hypothetical protein
MELAEITFSEGQNNTPGISHIALAKYSDVFSWPDVTQPDPETALSAPDDLITVRGNIALKCVKTMVEVYHTDLTGEFKFETQGELDAKSFKQSLVFNVPIRAQKLLGTLTGLKDTRLVIIARTKGGEKLLMGSYGFPVRLVTAPGTFGNNATSNPMVTVTLECDDPCAVRYFNGDVKVGSGSYGGSGAGAFTQTLFAD